MRRLLLIATALLALAPAAAGAATWTAPQTVSAPHTFAGPLMVTTTFDGTTLAAWPWQDNVGNDAFGGESLASRPSRLTGADFGAQHAAPAGVTALAPFARTQALALAVQGLPSRDSRTGAFRSRLNVAFGPAAGPFGATRTLATVPLQYVPQLTSGGATALVTWIEITKTSSGAIRRVVRAIDRRNGAWGNPYTLSGTGRADAISTASNADDDQVLAFARAGKLLVRVRRHGHSWGAIRTLATATGSTQWQLATGINARGQVRVVWRRHELAKRTALETSALLVGRSTFTTPQTLTPNGASATFRLTEIPTGWAVADVEANQPILRQTLGGSQFAAGQAAAPAQSGARGADVTWSPVAGITVAWVQPLNGLSDGVARAASYANGAFTAPEDVSPPETVHEVRLAADARAGQPVALWTARPTGQPPSLVRAAARRP